MSQSSGIFLSSFSSVDNNPRKFHRSLRFCFVKNIKSFILCYIIILGGFSMVTALNIANAILYRSFNENIDLTPMKLQRLLYLTHQFTTL